MSKHQEILKSEEAIRQLMAELEQLKTARQSLDDAADGSRSLQQGSQALIHEVGRLAGNAEDILQRLQLLDLDTRLAKLVQQLDAELRGFRGDIQQASDRGVSETHQLSEDVANAFVRQSATLTELGSKLEERLTALETKAAKDARVMRIWLLFATGAILAMGITLFGVVRYG